MRTESPAAVQRFEVAVVAGCAPVIVAAWTHAGRDASGWADLPAAERRRAGEMGGRRAAEFVRGRSLLRRLTADVLGVRPPDVPIGVRPRGRPFVPGAGLGVSVSHTEGCTAAAVWAGGQVGVDVQGPPSGVDERLIRRCCGPWAAQVLAADRRDVAFARVWCVQEACVKAVGLGLAALPWRIPVPPAAARGRWGGRWGPVVWRRVDAFTPAALAVAALARAAGPSRPHEEEPW